MSCPASRKLLTAFSPWVFSAAALDVGQDAILSTPPAHSRRSCGLGCGTRCHLVPPQPAHSRRSCGLGCGTRCHLVPLPACALTPKLRPWMWDKCLLATAACALTPKLRPWMWDKMPSCPTASLRTHAEAAALDVGQDAILSHCQPAHSRRSCGLGCGTRCHLVPLPACALTPRRL